MFDAAVVLNRGPYTNGSPMISTDGNGVETQYTYDSSNGSLTSVTEAYGSSPNMARTTNYQFDANSGQLNSQTDYNGLTRSYTRDSLGRAVAVLESGGSGPLRETSTVYEDANRRVITTSDSALPADQLVRTVTEYDQLGRVRLTRQLEASSQGVDDETAGIKGQTRYGYSSPLTYKIVSNPYRADKSSDAGGESTMGWTVSASDWQHRVSSATAYGGATVPTPAVITGCTSVGSQATCYGGNTTTVTDEAGVSRTNTVDALGRVTQVVENGIGAATAYTYDALGDLTGVAQAGMNGRSFAYDSLGRLQTAINPESGTTSYGYDGNGNLTTRTDGRGAVATTTYDALNRSTGKSYSGGPATPAVTYSYAGATDFLSSVSSSASVYNYSNYDALGRPGAGSQTTGGQTWTFPSVVWTPGGQVRSLTYPSGRVVTTAFDAAGRIAGVTGTPMTGSPVTYAGQYTYAAHGGPAAWTTGDGLSRSISYNARLQPTSITAGSLLTLGLGYSATGNNGNLQSETIVGQGGFSATQTFVYDGANRLCIAAEAASAVNFANCQAALGVQNWQQAYTYDNAGNRAVVSNLNPNAPQNSSLINWNYTPQTPNSGSVPFDANNHWIGTGTYDGAGNLTMVRTESMTYDAESRTTDWSDASTGASVAFTYDGDGRRVTKTSSAAGTTTYVYDPAGNLAAEYGGVAPAVTGTTWLTADHLGSTRLVTNGGGCVGAHDYLPFGEEIPGAWGRSGIGCYGATDTGWKFTGQERDAETGLDNFLARMVMASEGRFLSADAPLIDQDPRDPQSWNLYSYVRNRPLSFVDLDGQKCVNGIDDQSQDACFTAEGTAKAPSLFSRILGSIGDLFTGFGKEAGGNTLIGTTNMIDLMRQKVYGGPDFRQPLLQPTNNSQFIGSMYGMVFPLMIPGAGEAGILGETAELSPFAASKALASDLQMQEILSGSGVPIAGAGTSTTLRDASRLAATYGGEPGDWAKIASSNYVAAGRQDVFLDAKKGLNAPSDLSGNFEIHAYQNVKTGQIVELKTKFQ